MTHKQGLSLIELMVTLALVGVGLGAVVVTLAPRPGPAEAAARDLARALDRAGRDALITGAALGLHVDAAGYRWARRDLGLWRPLEAPRLYPAGDWDREVRVALWVEGEEADFARDPGGRAAGTGAPIPPIRYDAAGTATAFRLLLEDDEGAVEVTGDAAGEIAWERLR